MPTNDEKQTLAQAAVLQRAREEKAARVAKPDNSAKVKAYALGTVQGHDSEGLPYEHTRGTVFNSTVNELKGLNTHGIAREATADEIAADEDGASDEEEDPEPSETDETAPGRTIRNYHEYKHEAQIEGGSAPDAEVEQEADEGDEEADEGGASDEEEEEEEEEGDEPADVDTMDLKSVKAELKSLGYAVDKSATLEDLRPVLVTARQEAIEEGNE